IYSHPCVKEAAVIGVPDLKWGELVMACVVLKDGSALTADELIEYCRTRLAGYKAPRRIEFIAGELPKSGTNKILKRKLREPYWKDAGRRVGCALAAFLLTSAAALAQNAPSIEAGQKAYGEHCAACHGTDAEGSD